MFCSCEDLDDGSDEFWRKDSRVELTEWDVVFLLASRNSLFISLMSGLSHELLSLLKVGEKPLFIREDHEKRRELLACALLWKWVKEVNLK